MLSGEMAHTHTSLVWRNVSSNVKCYPHLSINHVQPAIGDSRHIFVSRRVWRSTHCTTTEVQTSLLDTTWNKMDSLSDDIESVLYIAREVMGECGRALPAAFERPHRTQPLSSEHGH